MINKHLTPCMQRRYDPRLPPNMFFIKEEFKQRIPYCSEEDIGYCFLIPQPQHIHLVRYRENHMIMSTLQEPLTLPLQPLLDLQPVALRTYSVPA